jgi:hypothetical protein
MLVNNLAIMLLKMTGPTFIESLPVHHVLQNGLRGMGSILPRSFKVSAKVSMEALCVTGPALKAA